MTGAIFISVAIALRILSSPLANVFQKKLSTGGNHPLMINFITNAILAGAGILLLTDLDRHDLSADFWIYSLLGGIAGSLGNGFLVKALHLGDLSVLGPVNACKSVIALIAGVFPGYRIFHEQNILKKLSRSVIMLGGSVLIILMS